MKTFTTVRLALSGITFRLACDETEAHRLLRGAGVAYSLEPVDKAVLQFPMRYGWPVPSRFGGDVGVIRDA